MNHTVSSSLCAIIVPQYAIHWSRPSLIPQRDSRMWLLKEARLVRPSEERSLCTITTQTSQQRGRDKVQTARHILAANPTVITASRNHGTPSANHPLLVYPISCRGHRCIVAAHLRPGF